MVPCLDRAAVSASLLGYQISEFLVFGFIPLPSIAGDGIGAVFAFGAAKEV